MTLAPGLVQRQVLAQEAHAMNMMPDFDARRIEKELLFKPSASGVLIVAYPVCSRIAESM
jgi:hypothetical protein